MLGTWFYEQFIKIYGFALLLASLFSSKATFWIQGRRGLFKKLEEALKDETAPIIWFHVASLGEFEQARPVIEKLKNDFPQKKILLTFFSPSGYEIRKNYDNADYIFYLPLDTQKNARRFLAILKPEAIFWVKYEFWYNFLTEIHRLGIPIILFSTIFREEQWFFKYYGKWFQTVFTGFTWTFTQDNTSVKLLQSIGVKNVSQAGDTRFDRVKEILENKKSILIAESFKDNQKTLVIGSSWWRDIAVLLPFFNEISISLKIIIAPHEIKDTEIKRLQKLLKKSSIRFSEATTENVKNYEVLIIDNIGMLSSLYQYGEFAYIGGAFGEGLHNILESAVYGMPIFFGRKYDNFYEAVQLVKKGGAFTIQNTLEFSKQFSKLYVNEEERQKAANITQEFVNNNLGSSDLILKKYKELVK